MRHVESKTSPAAEFLPLALALLLVLSVGILAYRAWAAYSSISDQENITLQVVVRTNALMSSLKDAETGQRGFLLTGEDRYLDPYRQAISEIPSDLNALAQLEVDRRRPDQSQPVDQLRPLVNAKLDELRHTIELRRSGNLDTALEIVRTDRGKLIMDQIRAICSEIQTASFGLLNHQRDEARTKAHQAGLIGALGSAGVLALLLLATVTIQRGTRRRLHLINALHNAESRTRESRDWLQTTLSSIGDAVITTDTSGIITLLNPVAQSLTGWRQEEAVGRPLEDVFVISNVETGAPVENPVSKVLREGRVVGLANHTRLTAKDGRQIHIDDSAAPIREGGKIAGVVMVFRDITAQRQAEATTLLLASIVSSSDDAIIGKDLNGIIETWNRGAERMFGYSASEAVGQPVSILVSPEHQDEMPRILDRIRSGERVDHFETIRKRKDGTLLNISLTVSPVHDAAGRIIGASKIARDVTEQVRTRTQIAELAERLRITLSSIGDAVIATDPAGAVTYMNPVAEDLTGWPASEATGKLLPEVFRIVNEETRKTVENPVSKVLREGTVVGLANHTLLIARSGQECAIDDSAAPIRDAHGAIAGVVMVFRDNTATREAEERLRLAVEAAPNAMIMVGSQGRIVLVNSQTRKLFGYERHELLGQPVEMLVPARYRTGHDSLRTSFLNDPAARPMGAGRDLFGLHKDGREVPIEIGLNPISTSQGNFVLAAIIDISERKRAEDNLRATNEELRRTVHLIEPVACFVRDLQDRIVFWNPGATDLYGFSKEEAIGQVSHALLNTRFPAPLADILAQFKTAGAWDGELLHTHRDGRHITVTSHWALHSDGAGRPVAILEANLDITHRKEAELSLARAQGQLKQELSVTRRLHELGNRLMLLDDLPSVLHEVLAAAQEITGADKGHLQLLDATGFLCIAAHHGFSKDFLDFFSCVDKNDPTACSTALLANRRIVVEDVERSPIFAGAASSRVLLADGVRAVQSTPIVTRTGELIGMLSTHYSKPHQPSDRDLRLIDLLAQQAASLIERFHAEETLRATNAALLRANTDLKHFAFAASHDLQEPLRVITSYSQLLLKGYVGEQPEDAAQYVAFITDGTRKMRELLTDLLSYTQLTNPEQESIEPIDLNVVLERILKTYETTIRESHASVTSDHLPTIPAHLPHLVQLFQNLIGNALKYHGREAPRIHISVEKQNGMVRLGVADNGIGIDPKYHQDIFGVFKRLHSSAFPGTGIGLAICQRVVERYGGRIWVESNLNQGSTFYFTLPIAKRASAGRAGDAN